MANGFAFFRWLALHPHWDKPVGDVHVRLLFYIWQQMQSDAWLPEYTPAWRHELHVRALLRTLEK